MKKNFLFIVFISITAVCNAQLVDNGASVYQALYLNNAPLLYTQDQHINWIVDSYTGILQLTPAQKQTVYQTILASYKEVLSSDLYPKIKTRTQLEMHQAMTINHYLSAKFKEILSPAQYAAYKQIEPCPELCYSLNKEYKLYAYSSYK